MNRVRGSVVDSKFLCPKYDDMVDQEVNETNSWEWDHCCNTENVTTDRKYLGEVDTFDIYGIQGRDISDYYEQRRPKVGMFSNCYMWGGV